jgi:hypothetical protein
VVSLVGALQMPAVASVALMLLQPRRAAVGRPAPIDEVLREDHPVRAALVAKALDPARIQVAEMDSAISDLRRANEGLTRAREHDSKELGRANDERHALAAEIARLKRTRSFRIGEAIDSSRGLGDTVRLPFRLLHIALSKRDGGETREG